MESWSPFTRRMVALGIGIGLLWLLVFYLLLPLATAMVGATDHLADARFELAKLRQLESRPEPPKADAVPPNLVITGASPDAALQGMERTIRAAAETASVTIDSLAAVPQPDQGSGQIALRISVSGDELQIRQFIAALELGKPVIRFRPWQMSPDGGKLRFEATAISHWQEGRP